MKKLISEQIVDYLVKKETKHVFGLCGHTVIGMLDAIEGSKLNFVSVRHEQVAAHAADGYARVTKKASVLLTHLGPGLTNAATGVANAALDSIPMVVIAGDVPSYYYGKHPHQEIYHHNDGSQYEIYKPFVKRAWRVDNPEAIGDILDRAFRLSESGRPGPVLVSVPMDIFSKEIDTKHFERAMNSITDVSKPSLDKEIAKKVARMLVDAKNPGIHAGGGVLLSQATEELAELAELLDLPVTRTLMGQGCIPDSHPLQVGMTGFWGTEFVHSITTGRDLLLGIGSRFAEADSSSWYEGVTFDIPNKTKLIQIDIDPVEIGRNYPVVLGAMADAKLALRAIIDEVRAIKPEGVDRPELREAIASAKKRFKEENAPICKDMRFPMTPQKILTDVREVLPTDGIILTDVGWNKNGMGQQFDISIPGTIHHPSGLATMGFGPAAVLGAKLGDPSKVAITLVGDGGFGTNPSVMATAVEQGIPVIWVVMNNNCFGTIAGLTKGHYDHTFGTQFTTAAGERYETDFAQIAKGYGVKSKKITSTEEFKVVLEEAINCGEPYLIDVPMENIPVPTDGVWNINDIYTPKENVKDGVHYGGEVFKSKHKTT